MGFERDVMHFVFVSLPHGITLSSPEKRQNYARLVKQKCLSLHLSSLNSEKKKKKVFSLYFTFCFGKIIIGCSSRVLIVRVSCLSKILVNSKVMSTMASMTSGQDISFQTSTNK